MKRKKVLVAGFVIVTAIGAFLMKKKGSKKHDEWYEDNDFDDDFDDDFLDDDEEYEKPHVVKRFCVTDKDTIQILDEIFGNKMEAEDE